MNYRPPKVAFACGLALVFGLAGLLNVMLHGEMGEEAIQLAQSQTGQGYSYHVRSLQVSGNRVSAVVTAYTPTSIEQVNVQWERARPGGR